MGMWEGIPAKRRLVEPRRSSGHRYALSLVVVAVLLALAYFGNLLPGGEGSKPTATPAPTTRPAAAAPVAPTNMPTPPPTSTPGPTASPTAEARTLVVANTQGLGVFIRRSPSLTDRIKAWPERTVMVVVGEDRETNGTRWRNVRDPDGNVGWVPADFLVAPTPVPTPRAAPTRTP